RTTPTRSTGFPLPSPASSQTSPSFSTNCGALTSTRPNSTQSALRASTTNDPRELTEFRNQAQRSIRSIDGLVSDIDPDLSTELFGPIARLRANVRGETNIFGLRQTEIETTAKSKQLIAENTALSAHLHNAVEQLVTSSREDIDTAALVANRAQQFNTNVLLS